MKTIGLIGGASYESTAAYYRIINERVRRRNGGLASPPLLLHSFNTEEILRLQQQGDWDLAAAQLAQAAVGLYDAGARCLGICTTALHRVAAEVREALPIDATLLHMGDSVGLALRQAGVRRVALLDTAQAMERPFLGDYLSAHHDIETVVPGTADRRRIHEIIFGEMRRDAVRSEHPCFLRNLAMSLKDKEGVEGVVFGSAELALIACTEDDAFPLPLFDATMLHARAIADYVLFQPSTLCGHPNKQREIGEFVGNIY